jgi:RNA polymerase sigma factor (sigma-70 family)
VYLPMSERLYIAKICINRALRGRGADGCRGVAITDWRKMRHFHRDDDIVELYKAAVDGDESAWRALDERFTPFVWSVARAHRLSRADSEDVVQYVWFTLAQNLAGIREPACLGSWLFRVARNECLRALRQPLRQIPTDDIIEPDCPDERAYADAFVLLEERNAELWRAVDRLPSPCRQLLRMLFGPGAPPTYEEVSSQLNMPIGSVGPRRQRCLERLQRFLL